MPSRLLLSVLKIATVPPLSLTLLAKVAAGWAFNHTMEISIVHVD